MDKSMVLHRPTGIEKLRLFFIFKEHYIDTGFATMVFKIMDGKYYVVAERPNKWKI